GVRPAALDGVLGDAPELGARSPVTPGRLEVTLLLAVAGHRIRGPCHASPSQQPLHPRLVGLRDQARPGQVPLPLGRLLRQDVALVGLPAPDLAGAGEPEALRRALVRLHLGHRDLPKPPRPIPATAGAHQRRGARIIVMLRPSRSGSDSTRPTSSSPWATRISTSRPISGWAICRPRNIIVALTLLPSSRKRRACRILNSKSCGSMPGRNLTSLIWIWCCFLRASRALRACSYLNLP